MRSSWHRGTAVNLYRFATTAGLRDNRGEILGRNNSDANQILQELSQRNGFFSLATRGAVHPDPVQYLSDVSHGSTGQVKLVRKVLLYSMVWVMVAMLAVIALVGMLVTGEFSRKGPDPQDDSPTRADRGKVK